MKSLESRLYVLLYRYPCVVVPGFGAFLTQKVPACLNESGQTLIPPSRHIHFNAQLTHNDGLLATLIAQDSDMSHEEALLWMASEVKKWNETIAQTGQLALNKLGTFSKYADQPLVFTPNLETNFLKESFGLSAMPMAKISREVVAEPIAAPEESVVELPVVTSIITPERPYAFLRYAAIYLVGFSVVGFSALRGVEWASENHQQQVTAVHQRVDARIRAKIQQASFVIENPFKPQSSVASTPIYHVVAGSFREKENAQESFKQLLDQGFQAHILPKNEQGMYPVVYGSFASLDTAQQTLKTIQLQQNAEAWLLIR
ncbi:MAG: hypothetical protein CFE24_14295 [Flavobacterium sp. BFFFF2]|nr:MAG: hypothetical protein CFE24_14295 [Flavobacterium sp. BFFFF2]